MTRVVRLLKKLLMQHLVQLSCSMGRVVLMVLSSDSHTLFRIQKSFLGQFSYPSGDAPGVNALCGAELKVPEHPEEEMLSGVLHSDLVAPKLLKASASSTSAPLMRMGCFLLQSTIRSFTWLMFHRRFFKHQPSSVSDRCSVVCLITGGITRTTALTRVNNDMASQSYSYREYSRGLSIQPWGGSRGEGS